MGDDDGTTRSRAERGCERRDRRARPAASVEPGSRVWHNLDPPMTTAEHDIFQIERPDPKLWIYYFLTSFLAGPFFFILLVPLWFRYHTLHYRFDQEGISMGWGILFRREINLTYSRIQDIHLVSNIVERWLGLARIQIQTASGSASAEMTIAGLLQFERVRDFLYSRMRGARDAAAPSPATTPAPSPSGEAHDLALVLAEVAAELRAVRLALEASSRRPSE
jgi:putative membrane protein